LRSSGACMATCQRTSVFAMDLCIMGIS